MRSGDLPLGDRLWGLQSGPGSLNQHDQKVDTVHESITQGGKLLAPCDPVASLIRATNLPNGQIIEFCREGDLYINNSLHPCLHLISFAATESKTTWMHRAVEKLQRLNGNEPLSLNILILCFLCSSYLFLHSFVSPSIFHPLWSTGDSIPVSFTVTNSQSPSLTHFTC